MPIVNNLSQPVLIGKAIERMPEQAEIILAMDNDSEGRKLAKQIATATRATGRDDLTITRVLPAGEGQDWNDILRQQARQVKHVSLENG